MEVIDRLELLIKACTLENTIFSFPSKCLVLGWCVPAGCCFLAVFPAIQVRTLLSQPIAAFVAMMSPPVT